MAKLLKKVTFDLNASLEIVADPSEILILHVREDTFEIVLLLLGELEVVEKLFD